jgi:hypothetical protein
MGQKGRMARRRNKAAAPTITTESVFLRAIRPKLASMERNQEEPMRGRANATAMLIAVIDASISINEVPVSWLGFIAIF